MIDIKGVLDELGIDYKTHGKNVGVNDVVIDCPYCNADKHLGINKSNGRVWCWVCEFKDAKRKNYYGDNRKPSLIDVLMDLTEERWITIKKTLEDYGWEEPVYDAIEQKNATSCKLPDGAYDFSKPEAKKAKNYLKNRGFGDKIIQKYNLKVSPDYGKYANRIIIPVFYCNKIVSFTSRDYTGRDQRYKNANLNDSIASVKGLLYNYDSAKDFKHIYLLEGPTDVWKMGDDSVAVFRSSLSSEQRKLLLDMNLDSITIVFDPLATSRAIMAAGDLSPFIRKIKVVRLEGIRDVGDMHRYEVLEYERKTNYFRG